jgi:hypothetical protein
MIKKKLNLQGRNCGRGAGGAAAPGISIRGGKLNSLHEKNGISVPKSFCFVETNHEKVNKRVSLKFIASISDDHCDFSPQAPKDVAAPLFTGKYTRDTFHPSIKAPIKALDMKHVIDNMV